MKNVELYSGILCPNEDGSFDLEVFYKSDGKHYVTLQRTPARTFANHCLDLFRSDTEAELYTMAVNADTQIENSR